MVILQKKHYNNEYNKFEIKNCQLKKDNKLYFY